MKFTQNNTMNGQIKMKIKLFLPHETVADLIKQGYFCQSPEVLKFKVRGKFRRPNRSESLLKETNDQLLTNEIFQSLRNKLGAWIEVDCQKTKYRVCKALNISQLDPSIKIVEDLNGHDRTVS